MPTKPTKKPKHKTPRPPDLVTLDRANAGRKGGHANRTNRPAFSFGAAAKPPKKPTPP